MLCGLLNGLFTGLGNIPCGDKYALVNIALTCIVDHRVLVQVDSTFTCASRCFFMIKIDKAIFKSTQKK